MYHSFLIHSSTANLISSTASLTVLLITCYSLAAAKSLQSCPTLCNPRDGSPPGSPVPGILQARTLEWVAISFSDAWKWKVKVKSLSRVQLLATPWTAAYQAPPSMGFSRQEYWSRVPSPSPMLLPYFDANKRFFIMPFANISVFTSKKKKGMKNQYHVQKLTIRS